MWQKLVTRKISVQLAQAWNTGAGRAMKKEYGVWFHDTLVFRDARKSEYYVDADRLRVFNNGLERLLTRRSFLRSFHRNAQRALERLLRHVQRCIPVSLTSASSRDLLSLYKTVILRQEAFYVRMWTVFTIAKPAAALLENALLQGGHDSRDVTNLMQRFATPLEWNDVMEERVGLLRLAAARALSKTEQKKRLVAHAERYKHIPLFDLSDAPYPIEHFAQSLHSIKNPKKELMHMTTELREHRRAMGRALARVEPSPSLLPLCFFLNENAFLRDYRDMLRQKLNLALQRFYVEAGKRMGLSLSEVVSLTNDEIMEYLHAEKKFPHRLIRARMQAFVLEQHGSAATILSGKAAEKRARALVQSASEKKEIELRATVGSFGSQGKVRGRAVIVYTNRDLYKVQRGDVLVAPMTRQDFVPAMRLASAVVTDEGSVTAHAAIIARELAIPCLVAAKRATTVFVDGDLVEVDAERGIVRKVGTKK